MMLGTPTLPTQPEAAPHDLAQDGDISQDRSASPGSAAYDCECDDCDCPICEPGCC